MVLRGNAEGPLFLLSNGKVLYRQLIVKMLKETLTKARVDFSGHSFQIGAAIENGISDATIQLVNLTNATLEF